MATQILQAPVGTGYVGSAWDGRRPADVAWAGRWWCSPRSRPGSLRSQPADHRRSPARRCWCWATPGSPPCQGRCGW
ncbi:hypothetical protein HBB16_02275 [Pseudonocardia sp. MCCB 268]|nr:hypothetical protein [Pseudonocardia cytotoxica]